MKNKGNGMERPRANFETKIKPSHIIEAERIRETVDPVPISIRLAMGKSNKKIPLQNRNWVEWCLFKLDKSIWNTQKAVKSADDDELNIIDLLNFLNQH